ncbi:uncharacterized protein PRCAT00000176001 [Priceomyces carsonii]|uniref:uncharacterized protein n=1 Tax=Priceomyces carsonii TaxID=28549 RepID=UPI002EDACBC4|nr:unnamed protein product [Priceomyces carsonii]
MSNSIAHAFRSLKVSGSETSDHMTIYDVSYQYLSKVKNFDDVKAFKNCLVALINLDRYYKALELIKKISSSDSKSQLMLEIAYVYYKLEMTDELFKFLHEFNPDNTGIERGLKHIIAQAYYKTGEYEKSLDLYRELIDNIKYDNSIDLVVNERAIISQLNVVEGRKVQSNYPMENKENYDLYFNEALIFLSVGDMKRARALLEKAEHLCLSQNSDASRKDLISELLPIKLTVSFIHLQAGEIEQCQEIFKEFRAEDISDDAMLKLIFKNDFYCVSDSKPRPNLIARDVGYQENLHHLLQKLTKCQYQVVLRNNLLLKFMTDTLGSNYLSNSSINSYAVKYTGDMTLTLYKLFAKLDIRFEDINNDLYWRKTSKKLLKFIKRSGTFSDEIVCAALFITFLNAHEGRFDQCLPVLEQLVEYDLSKELVTPALIGTLINLYEKLNMKKKLTSLFDRLTPKLLGTQREYLSLNSDYYNSIKAFGFVLYNMEDYRYQKIFKLLSEVGKDDKLISSLLSGSTTGLLPIDDLCSEVPIDDLLSTELKLLAPPNMGTMNHKNTHASRVTKRLRKPKFSASKVIKPKSEMQIDEERWLPLKLRSYYKPKKDKKKTGGHQGASEILPSPSPSSVSSSQGGSTKSKRKKKGKK